MRKEVIVPVTLALVGLIFLVGGVGAYFFKAHETMVCEACGMELKIGEQMPVQCHTIVSGDGTTHYGCCPICALAIAYYYKNATVSVQCFACPREITIVVENGNLSSVTPTTAGAIFGAACTKNKMVCCQDCAEAAKQNYDWAKDLPVITMLEAFSKGKMKVGTTSISPKAIKIPTITYALIAGGIVLLAVAPISWGIMTGKIPKKKTVIGIFFIGALFITLGSSVYAAHLGKCEMLHFWVFFPAGRGPPPTPLEIHVNEQGFLKRIFNPWVEALSTHWIINTGNKSYIVGLRLVNCTIPVKWEVSAGIPWDPETKTFTQPLGPGEGIPDLGIDWIFHIPNEVRSQKIWYKGGLEVFDGETDKRLSFIPITIYGGWGLSL